MRLRLALAAPLFLAACANGPSARPDAAAAPSGTVLGTVGDVAVLALDAAPLAALDREERLLAWRLAQATIASHPVALLQNHRDDLAVWDLVEALLSRREALDPVFALELADYRRLLFLHHGIHDALTEEKLAPAFDFDELAAGARRAAAAGARLPAEPPLAELRPILFDPEVDRFRVAKTPGPAQDPVAASSSNHYAPGITSWDLFGFSDRFPLNSRVVREGPKLVEAPYRAGGPGVPAGLGARELGAAVRHLEEAAALAPPAEQRTLSGLAAFLRSGDDGDFEEHDLLWLHHPFRVDYVLGFVDPDADPRQVKGVWEALVALRDPVRSAPLERLAAAAAWFEERMPFRPQDRRPPEEVRPPTVSAVSIVAAAGDALGFTPEGLTLPGSPRIREANGAKSWVAVSVADAVARFAGDRQVRELVLPEVADEAARCWRDVDLAKTAYREILGHPSGRSAEGTAGDPRRLLAPYYGVLEEARAEAVALYQLGDPRTVVLGMLPDGGCQAVADHLAAMEFLGALATVPRGDRAERDRLRATLLLQGWQTDHGAVRIVARGGARYAQVVDRAAWRRGLAALAELLQRSRSTGDRRPIEELVDRYATRIDPGLRDEVVARLRRIGLPGRVAVFPPVLEAVRDRTGRPVDARARTARSVDDLIEVYERARRGE